MFYIEITVVLVMIAYWIISLCIDMNTAATIRYWACGVMTITCCVMFYYGSLIVKLLMRILSAVGG